MLTCLCFVTLSAVLWLASLSIAQPATLADVQIVSISGCVDEYPITVNCSLNSVLHLHTNGFPTDIDWAAHPLNIVAQVGGYTYFTTTTPSLDSSTATTATVTVNISATAYYPHITGVLVSVHFVDNWTQGRPTSASFAGFSYLFEGPPVLASISGCAGSGLSTQSCVPDQTVLVLTGSGLSWFAANDGVQLNIGNVSSLSWATPLLVSNDNYATLDMSWIYGRMLKPQHYAGVLLNFSLTSVAFTEGGQIAYFYTTNVLQISFVPLPSPSVTTWFFTGCNETDANLATYTSCLPGVAQLYLQGNYLYDVRVSVNGSACTSAKSPSALSYICLLPSVMYDPSVSYDVLVYNDAGSQTFSGLVQYTAKPLLISVDQCIDRGPLPSPTAPAPLCPAGTTITLRGSRFPVMADTTRVQFVVDDAAVEVNFTAPTLINSSTITFVLTELDNATAAVVYGATGTLHVLFNAAGVTTATNSVTTSLYLPPNAPNITSVTSSLCVSVLPLLLSNCHATASITIMGTNLNAGVLLYMRTSTPNASLRLNFLASETSSSIWDVYTSTMLVFTLPYFDADTNLRLQPSLVYTVSLTQVNEALGSVQSNAFRLSLTYNGATAAGTAASSSTLSSGAIAGISIAAVVAGVLLFLTAVWLVRGQSCGGCSLWSSKSSSDDGVPWFRRSNTASRSDAYVWDVELQ